MKNNKVIVAVVFGALGFVGGLVLASYNHGTVTLAGMSAQIVFGVFGSIAGALLG